jgi:tetratricopeptide (TPR) repeat protein
VAQLIVETSHRAEAADLLQRARTLAPAGTLAAARVEAVTGELSFAEGRPRDAVGSFLSAGRIYEACCARSSHARALSSVAYSHVQAGELSEATEVLERALVVMEGTGQAPWSHAMAVPVLQAVGDIDGALAHARIAHQLALGRGTRSAAAAALNNIACMLGERGECREAMEAFGQVARLRAAAGDRGRAALAQSNLGQAALELGDLRRASDELRRALALYELLGAPTQIGRVRCLLGVTAHVAGDLEDAARHLEHAREALADTQYARWVDLAHPEAVAALDILCALDDLPEAPERAQSVLAAVDPDARTRSVSVRLACWLVENALAT